LIPIFQPVIDQIYSWVFQDETVIILVGFFVVIIGLAFIGAKRMETN